MAKFLSTVPARNIACGVISPSHIEDMGLLGLASPFKANLAMPRPPL